MEEHLGQPERLLAGKYKSAEELETGYQNLYSLSINTFKEKEALEARVRELEMGRTERMDPEERRSHRPAEVLQEVGVPIDALNELIEERLQGVLNPVFQGMSARTELAQRYPDYPKVEQQLADFIGSNPRLRAEYQKVYQASPLVAMEWAYSQFRQAGGRQPGNPAADEVAARLDAQLMGGSNRDAAKAAEDESGEKAAWDHYQRTGDAGPLIRRRTQAIVPDSHFNGLPGTNY